MKITKIILIIIFCLSVIANLYYFFPFASQLITKKLSKTDFNSPFVKQEIFKQKELPLLVYTINNLKKYPYQSSQLMVEKILSKEQQFTNYLFTFTTMNKKMSGSINIPKTTPPPNGFPVIIMLRGYVPAEIYKPGVGTKNASKVLAENGYVTIAPDFFGFGSSDADFENSWEGRFAKPVNVIELIKSIEDNGLLYGLDTEQSWQDNNPPTINANKIGIWAHSNGGQIALTILEILEKNIPTTLWAPVTAPFPYSILFFTDELEDEGKETRAWLAMLEKDYDVLEFTLTKHLHFLTGPLQIHHGTNDDAALITWSDEFVEKIEKENKRRAQKKLALKNQVSLATETATIEEQLTSNLSPIEVQYYRYAGADHNLQPAWGTAIQRDLAWFEKFLVSAD